MPAAFCCSTQKWPAAIDGEGPLEGKPRQDRLASLQGWRGWLLHRLGRRITGALSLLSFGSWPKGTEQTVVFVELFGAEFSSSDFCRDREFMQGTASRFRALDDLLADALARSVIRPEIYRETFTAPLERNFHVCLRTIVEGFNKEHHRLSPVGTASPGTEPPFP